MKQIRSFVFPDHGKAAWLRPRRLFFDPGASVFLPPHPARKDVYLNMETIRIVMQMIQPATNMTACFFSIWIAIYSRISALGQ